MDREADREKELAADLTFATFSEIMPQRFYCIRRLERMRE
jgi:hypothetical protein